MELSARLARKVETRSGVDGAGRTRSSKDEILSGKGQAIRIQHSAIQTWIIRIPFQCTKPLLRTLAAGSLAKSQHPYPRLSFGLKRQIQTNAVLVCLVQRLVQAGYGDFRGEESADREGAP